MVAHHVMYSMPLNRTLKNSKIYVMYILPQFKKVLSCSFSPPEKAKTFKLISAKKFFSGRAARRITERSTVEVFPQSPLL